MNIETVTLAPGYAISRVAKGNWQLASRHSAPYAQEEAVEDMRRFVVAGINAFDCADHYVGVEDTIGVFRRKYPGLAKNLRVSTKYTPDIDLIAKLTRRDVEEAVNTSLRRLGGEQLDLVQFHWWDYEVPGCTQALLWLQGLQKAGKVGHIGTTNFNVAHMQQIVGAGVKLLTHQLQYSVLDLRPERGMAEFCQTNGIHLLCYGTIAGGFLSNKWLGQPSPPQPYANRSLVKYRLMVEEFGGWEVFQSALRDMDAIAKKHNSNIAAVAARYVLDKPQVAVALVGAKNAVHLDETLDIFRLKLDAEDTANLDSLAHSVPGPEGDCYDIERNKESIHARIMQMNQNTQGAPANMEMSPSLAALRGGKRRKTTERN